MSDKIYYLKLTGADSYGSPSVGQIKRDQSIQVRSAKLAEKLLHKGTINEDGSLKAFFTQVSRDEATGKTKSVGVRKALLNDALADNAAPATQPAKEKGDEDTSKGAGGGDTNTPSDDESKGKGEDDTDTASKKVTRQRR